MTLSGSARFTQSSINLQDGRGDDLTGDHSFTRVNPSAGLTVDLGSGVVAFASYSRSSRVPTPSELGCANPDDPCRLPNAFVSNPPLDEVVAQSVEGGARGRTGGVSWSASLFRTAISDDIIFVSSGALSNSATSRTRRYEPRRPGNRRLGTQALSPGAERTVFARDVWRTLDVERSEPPG